jgi:WD40 repeat protein
MPITLQLAHTFKIGNRAWRVALTRAGDLAAVSNYFGLGVWETGSGALRWKRDAPEMQKMPTAMGFSPDGRTLAACDSSSLWWLDPDTGAARGRLDLKLYPDRLWWSPDGASLWLSGSEITRWDVASGRCVQRLKGPKSFHGFSLDAEGRHLAATGDKSLWLWDLSRADPVRRYPVARFGAHAVALSPDASQAWTTEAGDVATCWSFRLNKKQALATASPGGGLGELAAAPDFRWLLISGERAMSLHDPKTGALLDRHPGKQSSADDIAVSADGRLALSAHLNGVGRLWRIENGG